MIRRPPRSTLDRSSAASDVYKRQLSGRDEGEASLRAGTAARAAAGTVAGVLDDHHRPVSYTHLRAHETVLDLVCRLLLEKKQNSNNTNEIYLYHANTITTILAPPSRALTSRL